MANIGFTLVVAIIALSVATIVWFAIDVGVNTLEQYRKTFTEKAKFHTQEFFLFIDPTKIYIANISIMLLGASVAWLFSSSFILASIVFIVLGLMPRLLLKFMRKKRLQKYEEQLPDALMMLSGGMRAGSGLSSAIGQLVAESPPPIGQEFGLILKEQRLGVTLEQSLKNLARRMPSQTNAIVISAMLIANETGGSLAETLERTSQTIRSRLQMEGKINALTAQGKLQAWVVGALPLVLMAILNKMEPEAMSLLWHSRLGWATLAVIAFLEIMGVYVIRKIIAIDV